MRHHRKRVDQIEAAIREVLIRDWDPIGVMADPAWPRDEYDAYLGEICGLLMRGEAVEVIAAHLCVIEDRWMGLGVTPAAARLGVAQTLKTIDVSLQD